MKHTFQVTALLIMIFVFTQIVGLYTVNRYLEVGKDVNGTVVVSYGNTTMGEPAYVPEQDRSYTFIIITISILIMTAILLLLIKFQLGNLWKYGFFLAVLFSLAVAFGVYINKYIAIGAALVLAYFKVFKPNPLTHNIVEIFLYAGIAILVLPLLNIYSAIGLLIVVSLYDMYAVWKSKHMITLAKFQADNKAFAGLSIPYFRAEKEEKKGMKVVSVKKAKNVKINTGTVKTEMKPKTAILGGGDIGFTLIFASVVMEMLIKSEGIAKIPAFFYSLIIVAFVTIALALLFMFSKKDKFYPAMPFLSAGCLVGFLAIMLII